MSASVDSTYRFWQTASAEGESEQREAFLFRLSHYLSAPQNLLVFEGLWWSKLSWKSQPLALVCGTMRLVAVAVFLFIPALVCLLLNSLIQTEGLRLQKGRGFSLSGSLSAPLPEKLRILSLNICAFPGNWNAFFGGIEASGYERLERFVQLFHKQNADIICLQEVFEPAFALKLRDRLRAEGWEIAIYNAGLDARSPLTSGLFVASRVPVREVLYTPFEPWFGGKLPRGVLLLGIGGLDLLVTHLTPSNDDLNPKLNEIAKRRAEAATIAEQLRERPTVLVGDLNAQKAELSSIGSLNDASPKGVTCTEQFTLDFAARLNGSQPAKSVPSTTLDRVFAQGLTIQPAIIPSFKSKRDSNPLSDHHALFVELTMPSDSTT